MKNTMKELTEGMQRLCAVANRIVAQDGRASRIEIDLLLEDLRGLYDVALRLNGDALPEPVADRSSDEVPVKDEAQMMAMMSTMAAMTVEEERVREIEKKKKKEKEEKKTEKKEEKVVEGKSPVTKLESEPVPVIEPEPAPVPEPEPLPRMEELEHNDNELLFDEIILEEVEEGKGGKVEEEKIEKVNEVQSKKEDVARMKSETPAAGQASLLDYLSVSASRTLGETLGADRPQPTSLEKKVDDLRTVININDKFSFMSELFHNNIKAYNDFIMRLNAMVQRDEAMAYVHEVAAQYKWDDGASAVQSFYKIFDKKF